MRWNLVRCAVFLIACWIFTNGCRSNHKTIVEESGDVRITKQPVEAEWQIIEINHQLGLPMRQLVSDKKVWLRETDTKRNGKMDDVRVRLSSGEYIEIKDTNGDGIFHVVNQIPPDH